MPFVNTAEGISFFVRFKILRLLYYYNLITTETVFMVKKREKEGNSIYILTKVKTLSNGLITPSERVPNWS